MRCRVFVAVFYCVAFSSLAFGATFIVPPDRDMIATADGIATGTVLDKSCQYTAGGRIETLVRIQLDERIKGDFGQHNVVTIHVPGGRVGDNFTMIPGAPSYQPEERVLVFLLRTPAHEWATLNLTLGKFKFARDITGEEIVIRDGDEIVGWDVDGSPYKEKTRSAEKFTRFVRDVIAGRDGTEDYLVPSRPSQVTAESKSVVTPNSFSAIGYTMDFGSGNTARWGSFGTGIRWVNQNTQPNAPNGGIDAIVASLAKWTDDCPTAINYTYLGLDASATGGLSGAPDGKNSFIFERNLSFAGAPPMPASCAGVIAVGGVSSAGSPIQTFDGSSFFTTKEVDVEGNIGLSQCSAFLASGNFISGMVHEVGHTLSLRHADRTRDNSVACAPPLECSNSAIMNHVIVNGLAGNLQTWDLNAIAALYPGVCTPAPTVTSLNFTSGPTFGGTALVLTGTNLVNGAGLKVEFGGTAADVVFVNAATLNIITPQRTTAGAVDVVVTNPDLQTGTKTNGFTYTPTPATTIAVLPNVGPVGGGTDVTITGTLYFETVSVTFGGTAATNVARVNPTTITCTTPAHAAGAVNVVVTNGDAGTSTATNGFTYQSLPPTIDSLDVTNGPMTGGTAVTITGTNFVNPATVEFGGAAATNVTVASPTSITLTTPAHAVGLVDVTVTTGGQPVTKNDAFTFEAVVLPTGDVNGTGAIDAGDIVYLANFLFAGGPPPVGSGDVNGDTEVNVLDLFYLVNFVFGEGAAPAP